MYYNEATLLEYTSYIAEATFFTEEEKEQFCQRKKTQLQHYEIIPVTKKVIEQGFHQLADRAFELKKQLADEEARHNQMIKTIGENIDLNEALKLILSDIQEDLFLEGERLSHQQQELTEALNDLERE